MSDATYTLEQKAERSYHSVWHGDVPSVGMGALVQAKNDRQRLTKHDIVTWFIKTYGVHPKDADASIKAEEYQKLLDLAEEMGEAPRFAATIYFKTFGEWPLDDQGCIKGVSPGRLGAVKIIDPQSLPPEYAEHLLYRMKNKVYEDAVIKSVDFD